VKGGEREEAALAGSAEKIMFSWRPNSPATCQEKEKRGGGGGGKKTLAIPISYFSFN